MAVLFRNDAFLILDLSTNKISTVLEFLTEGFHFPENLHWLPHKNMPIFEDL